jgi:uncharacterized protein YecE (DUF72 family)
VAWVGTSGWSYDHWEHVRGREVHAYVDNDGDGHAVRNARRLRELLGHR